MDVGAAVAGKRRRDPKDLAAADFPCNVVGTLRPSAKTIKRQQHRALLCDLAVRASEECTYAKALAVRVQESVTALDGPGIYADAAAAWDVQGFAAHVRALADASEAQVVRACEERAVCIDAELERLDAAQGPLTLHPDLLIVRKTRGLKTLQALADAHTFSELVKAACTVFELADASLSSVLDVTALLASFTRPRLWFGIQPNGATIDFMRHKTLDRKPTQDDMLRLLNLRGVFRREYSSLDAFKNILSRRCEAYLYWALIVSRGMDEELLGEDSDWTGHIPSLVSAAHEARAHKSSAHAPLAFHVSLLKQLLDELGFHRTTPLLDILKAALNVPCVLITVLSRTAPRMLVLEVESADKAMHWRVVRVLFSLSCALRSFKELSRMSFRDVSQPQPHWWKDCLVANF